MSRPRPLSAFIPVDLRGETVGVILQVSAHRYHGFVRSLLGKLSVGTHPTEDSARTAVIERFVAGTGRREVAP